MSDHLTCGKCPASVTPIYVAPEIRRQYKHIPDDKLRICQLCVSEIFSEDTQCVFSMEQLSMASQVYQLRQKE